MTVEKVRTSFDSLRAVRGAAKIAQIDTRGMKISEIRGAVIKAAKRIESEEKNKLPKNYRTIKTPPFLSDVAVAVSTIYASTLKKSRT